ncbi:MAG TPA: hypothetical protein ENG48_07565 [Candidatus Atribacteria bacterium]|nr:hypothetical protein [Candidatus Atribacteria bacterium]
MGKGALVKQYILTEFQKLGFNTFDEAMNYINNHFFVSNMFGDAIANEIYPKAQNIYRIVNNAIEYIKTLQ